MVTATDSTLLITRKQVASLLSNQEIIDAVEGVFNLYGKGKAPAPGILGIHVPRGGFHVKAGTLDLGSRYFASKTNANFPTNKQRGLPTIQGIVMLSDGEDGRLLALMDSIEITILRTGAATAVAAKYLARPESKTLTIIGCGNQGQVTLRMLSMLFPLERVFIYDKDVTTADAFAIKFSEECSLPVVVTRDVHGSVRQSDICVTCTPSSEAFIDLNDVSPGTFIAAVGADSENKQELDPSLVASAKLITDLTEQCASIGELHHALEKQRMSRGDVYAELGEIVAGKKPGRTSPEEIIVFDSTGMALQDVVAAVIVYEQALKQKIGQQLNFQDQSS